MYGKKEWKVDADIVGGFGTGFMVVSFDGIMSTSEEGAKKQVRSRLRKQGLKIYKGGSTRPIVAVRVYSPLEKLRIDAKNVFYRTDRKISSWDIVHIIDRSGNKDIMKRHIMDQINKYQNSVTQLKEVYGKFFEEE